MSESKTPRTDAKTQTVQMPVSINEWVTVSMVHSDFSRQLELENAELREWKADVEDSHRRIMSEQCPTDEVHCTCVPILRRENAELKAKLAEYER